MCYLENREYSNKKEFFRRSSVSVCTNDLAAFWESSQISEKLLRHALLRHLPMGNVLGNDIRYDLALAF